MYTQIFKKLQTALKEGWLEFCSSEKFKNYEKLWESLKPFYKSELREVIPFPAYQLAAQEIGRKFMLVSTQNGISYDEIFPGDFDLSNEIEGGAYDVRIFKLTTFHYGKFIGEVKISFPHSHECFNFPVCPTLQFIPSEGHRKYKQFNLMIDLLEPFSVEIDTSVLKDKHQEILHNLELGQFREEKMSLVLLQKDVVRPPHIHDKSSAKFYFITGTGIVIHNGNDIPYTPGTYMEIPAGDAHGFRIKQDTLMLSFQDKGGIMDEQGHIDFRYE
ncbi:cupin domain-containing protein [Patescibacteria group bacterium]|nr:cupin domain-containing protein [Patescibacteria group bacterium]